MDAKIIRFDRFGVEAAVPTFDKLGAREEYFLGTLYADRCDGVQVVLDIYVSRENPLRLWSPTIVLRGKGGYSSSGTMSCLIENVEATTNQFAFFFARDYVKANWWWIVTK